MEGNSTPLSMKDIHSLKVVNLRLELDKRGLEKSGLKADLVKRLEKSLLEESLDLEGETPVNGDEAPANNPETNGNAEVENEDEIEEEEADTNDEIIQENVSNENNDGPMQANELSQEEKPSSPAVESSLEDSNELPEDERGEDVEDINALEEQQQQPEGHSENIEDSNSSSKSGNKDIDSEEEAANEKTEDDQMEQDQAEPQDEIITDNNANQTVDDAEVIEVGDDKVEHADDDEDKVSVGVCNDGADIDMSDENLNTSQTEVDQSLNTNSTIENITVSDVNTDQSIEPQQSEDNYANESDKISVEAKGDSFSMDGEELLHDQKPEGIDIAVENKDNDEKVKNDGTVESEKTDIETKKDKAIDSKVESDNKKEPSDLAESKSEISALDSSDAKVVSSKKDNCESKDKSKEKLKDEKKKDLSHCVWISGLSSITKAVDLKNICSKIGKVVGAKVVTSAKTPGSQCFGFVTMSTSEEAMQCIEKLHKSVLHEKTIQVEKAKTDPTPAKKPISSSKSKAGDKKDEKSKSRPSSSKNQRSVTSRSRRDDSSRSSRDDHRRSHKDSKHSSRKETEKRDEKRSSGSKTSSKCGSPKKDDVKGGSSSSKKSVSPKKDDVKGSDTILKTDEVKAIHNKAEASNKETVDVKTIEEIRKERAEKIEREHKLREDRKKKERERERLLREERRKEQEKREKERKERARKEAERVRKEREKQRELEKQRERERERERERFMKERKEREEKDRRERERERQQLERERLERERLDREKKERERLERERLERERVERERLEKERLAREEHENRIERERQRLEQERLVRERDQRDRLERDRRVIDRGIDRGFSTNSMKRPAGDRVHHADPKRSTHEISQRKDFFSSTSRDERGSYVKDDVYDSAYGRRVDSRRENVTRREPARDLPPRRDVRHETREYNPYEQAGDIRRVVQRTNSESDRNYARERSPHRNPDSRYRADPVEQRSSYPGRDERSQNWLSAPNANAPKTLSDVLGRAGLTGILGNQAESKVSSGYQNRRAETLKEDRLDDRFFASTDARAYERNDVRSQMLPDREREHISRTSSREDRRDIRVDSRIREIERRAEPSRRELNIDTKDSRSERYRDSRADDRRDPSRTSDRREYIDRRDSRTEDRRDGHPEPRDYPDRRDTRLEDRRGIRPESRDYTNRNERDPPRHYRPELPERNSKDSGPSGPIETTAPASVTERRGLHPLAAEIGSRALPTIVHAPPPPRVLPISELFNRQLPVVSNPAGLPAAYAPAPAGLTIHRVPPTGIQLSRDGRLEYTRMAPPPPAIHQVRRF